MSNFLIFLATALSIVMHEVASDGTERYFFKSLSSNPNKPNEKDIAATFLAIMRCKSPNARIETDDGEIYAANEYQFPVHWGMLCLAARVYTSEKAMDCSDPWYDFEVDLEEDDESESESASAEGEPEGKRAGPETREPKVLSPNQVRRFFDGFNEHQPAGDKVELGKVEPVEGILIQQLQAFYDDGDLAWAFASGDIDPQVSQILQIEAPFDSHYMSHYEKFTERGVYKWCVKLN